MQIPRDFGDKLENTFPYVLILDHNQLIAFRCQTFSKRKLNFNTYMSGRLYFWTYDTISNLKVTDCRYLRS